MIVSGWRPRKPGDQDGFDRYVRRMTAFFWAIAAIVGALAVVAHLTGCSLYLVRETRVAYDPEHLDALCSLHKRVQVEVPTHLLPPECAQVKP